ncbi:MAG: MauE/DoxX family redox-associated membrane protein [Pseudomonadota bacterium]
MEQPAFHTRDENRGRNISDYWPLAVVIFTSAAGAYALGSGVHATTMGYMHYFMGLFLLIFAMLKLFHPSSFADGFQMYDLLAKRARGYAYAYPYIELLLALGYLSFAMPMLVYIATIVVFGFGIVGVVAALRKGLDINCPCMGTILSVPLSTVTLSEDGAMIVMAFVMLASYAA